MRSCALLNVVAARDEVRNITVDVKYPRVKVDDAAARRFVVNSWAVSHVRGEHVEAILDVGRFEDGTPYQVVEHLEGAPLSAFLSERGPLPVQEAIEFVRQASGGVAAAHGLEIVHRDLKPDALFCANGPEGTRSIKVLNDALISRTIGWWTWGDPEPATRAVTASPDYVSPEQIEGVREVDARTDIWSLGVILFELLTCRVPFSGASMAEVAFKILTCSAPRLMDFRADAPEGLQAVVSKCLQRERERRYNDAGQLGSALFGLVGSNALAAKPSLG
jgi:serine/threonine-protein kinase